MKLPIVASKVLPRTGSNYPAPFAERVAGREKRALGGLFGITAFGVNLTTLPPGAQSALRHRHTVQEEFVFILSGEVTLLHDDGETLCTEGMCVGFVPGGTAHCLVNRSEADATYLEVGDRRPGDRGDYPDDDLVAIHDGVGWTFTHRDGTPYQ
ncbi:cupin domain-containing protein [Sphingomonas jaspsi]|uniref:cupin domain-containing protein n=1 Tax=Sphingomonas jaspsi TaxID=392409 RepID=UPI0004B96BCA|nr:cupin domain-containing protein [Sphingomonas jaspsi]